MKTIEEKAKEKYPYEDGIENSHWNAHLRELREAYASGAKGMKEDILDKLNQILKVQVLYKAMSKDVAKCIINVLKEE